MIKKKGRVITLFGAGGDRDRGKRPLMAKAASTFSDTIFITSDNPRSENPETILEDVKKGVQSDCETHIIEDRSTAIRKAISYANENDILIVAGKGHENYQLINGKSIYFSDADEILKALTLK